MATPQVMATPVAMESLQVTARPGEVAIAPARRGRHAHHGHLTSRLHGRCAHINYEPNSIALHSLTASVRRAVGPESTADRCQQTECIAAMTGRQVRIVSRLGACCSRRSLHVDALPARRSSSQREGKRGAVAHANTDLTSRRIAETRAKVETTTRLRDESAAASAARCQRSAAPAARLTLTPPQAQPAGHACMMLKY